MRHCVYLGVKIDRERSAITCETPSGIVEMHARGKDDDIEKTCAWGDRHEVGGVYLLPHLVCRFVDPEYVLDDGLSDDCDEGVIIPEVNTLISEGIIGQDIQRHTYLRAAKNKCRLLVASRSGPYLDRS